MTEVTVIVPCHNQGHYLRGALQSVAAQTVSDWEVVVVDDGSTDDTAAAAREYEDSRFHYIFQENRGLSGARNAGISRARGRFLAFLDADDEWEPEFLSSCLTVLTSSHSALGVYALNSFVDEQGGYLPQPGGSTPSPHQFRRRLLEGGFFPVHAALVKKSVVEQAGCFDEKLTSLEDWDLWLRLSRSGSMIGISEPLVRYRVYQGSMSTDAERMHNNRMSVLANHFGLAEGQPDSWSQEKRYAYAFAYRASALGFLEQGRPERCRCYLDMAAKTWPGILQRNDTYYELACGAQPKGSRGRPAPAEIEANGQFTLDWLDSFFAAETHLRSERRRAYGQAYLALAMLSDQAGNWGQARFYMRRTVLVDPLLAINKRVFRRLLKLHAGQPIVAVMGRDTS